MRHRDVVRFGGKFVDEFVVADHRDKASRRPSRRQRPVVEPGAAAEPDPGPVDGQRGHEHHGGVGDRLGRQQRLLRLLQAHPCRDEAAWSVEPPPHRQRYPVGVVARDGKQHPLAEP